MRMTEVALDHLSREMEGAVVELRREAVIAVARQQRIREELARARAHAAWVEEKASRALRRGEELLARQILARGICTLKTRDTLEEELAAARGRVRELLDEIVRAENRAWRARGRPEVALARGGGPC